MFLPPDATVPVRPAAEKIAFVLMTKRGAEHGSVISAAMAMALI
jgi:hypothetical protein